jgi:predicted RNA-binding protein YlxR (DUF448 family)
VACGRALPKRELVRVVHAPDGSVVIDESGKLSGRGAYICRKKACLDKVLQQPRLLARTLKTNIPPATLELLAAYAKQLPEEPPEAVDEEASVDKGRSDEDRVVQENG